MAKNSRRAPRLLFEYGKGFLQSDINLLTQNAEVYTCGMAIDVLGFYGLWANRKAITMTGTIFRTASDDDLISWQENTLGNLFMHYRDGTFRFSRLKCWQPYAVRTAVSSFARASTRPDPGPADYVPTPSYQTRYRYIPEFLRGDMLFPTIDSVVTAFDETYNAPPDSSRPPDEDSY